MLVRSLIFASISLALGWALVFTSFSEWTGVRLVSVSFCYMSIFFHELGHALFGWLFGVPSLPSFDFSDGGGMTYHYARSWLLQILVWGALGWLTWFMRINGRAWMITTGCFTLLIAVISLTKWHQAMIDFMGHGAEVLIGAFLLMRGFWEIFLTRPFERWLNVVIGSFMICNVIKIGWQVGHDADYQADYLAQKGQHGFGDLSQITNFELGWTLSGVGLFLIVFAVLCTLVMVLLPLLSRDRDFYRW